MIGRIHISLIETFGVVQLSPTICVYGGLMDGELTQGSVKALPQEAKVFFDRVRVDVTSFEVR